MSVNVTIIAVIGAQWRCRRANRADCLTVRADAVTMLDSRSERRRGAAFARPRRVERGLGLGGMCLGSEPDGGSEFMAVVYSIF
jgi:hypothetical protein